MTKPFELHRVSVTTTFTRNLNVYAEDSLEALFVAMEASKLGIPADAKQVCVDVKPTEETENGSS